MPAKSKRFGVYADAGSYTHLSLYQHFFSRALSGEESWPNSSVTNLSDSFNPLLFSFLTISDLSLKVY